MITESALRYVQEPQFGYCDYGRLWGGFFEWIWNFRKSM